MPMTIPSDTPVIKQTAPRSKKPRSMRIMPGPHHVRSDMSPRSALRNDFGGTDFDYSCNRRRESGAFFNSSRLRARVARSDPDDADVSMQVARETVRDRRRQQRLFDHLA